MTEGVIWKKMTFFALPLLLGNLFQQLYNTADSLIVGNYLGSNALAAVSSAGTIIFFLVSFYIGLAMGAGVVIGNYIGAKDREQTQIAVHTTVALGLLIGTILTVVGILLTPVLLRFVGTPAEVMPDSLTYFRIYYAGSIGFVSYNHLTGILRAAGDSRHPLYYLIFSSVTNVILDIVFIRFFGMGVGGAAFATILAQFLSALLCFYHLTHIDTDYRLDPKKIRIHVPTMKRIIRIGVPTGVQNSVIGLANVVVQAHINYFGNMAMAGSGAYSKIEGFAFLPITSFNMATTTFIAQNIGAKQPDRARQGSRFGIICPVVIAELVGIAIFALAPQMIALFDATPEVVAFGMARARVCTLFYFLLAYAHAMAAVLRGAGRSFVPMVIMLVFWCVVRVSLLEIAALTLKRNIVYVNMVYPITWGLSCIAFTIYYLRFDFSKASIV
ncbi:MAG: MATE family efflux transporter [Lachnospiraceae bacterium]|nr:MATE family efflux transporter [Lachnospiraceae bacterium]